MVHGCHGGTGAQVAGASVLSGHQRVGLLLAALDRAEDDLDREPEDDQVGDHLAGDHQPRRLGLGGDVAEPDGGEHGDGEVQPVGVRQVLAEVLAESAAMVT